LIGRQLIKNFLKQHRNTILTIIFPCLIGGILLVYPNIIYAAGTGIEIEANISKMISQILNYISIFMFLILGFIGMLMDNNFIVGAGIEDVLHQIWVVIRNLVNIGFVMALLGAAFYMVLFPSGDKGINIKEKLPKFLLAMILVNFSWFGCRLLIDVSNVATSAVFAIPQSISPKYVKCDFTYPKDGKYETEENTNCFFMKSFTVDASKIKLNKDGSVKVDKTKKDKGIDTTFTESKKGARIANIRISDTVNVTLEELKSSVHLNKNNAVMIMALNLASIQNLPLVASQIKSSSALTINIVFSLIISLIIIIPLIVLLIVLVGRMIVLWLTICFMPIAFLGWIIKDEFTGAIFDGVPNVVEWFINAVFVPVYIGIPLSVGFLMINAANSMGFEAKDSGNGTTFDLVIKPSIAGMSDVRQILWYIATAGILWMSIEIAASKGPEFMQGTINTIKDTSTNWGKWLAQAPIKYTPLIPIQASGANGKMDRYSLSSVFSVPKLLRDKLETNYGANKGYDLLGKMFPKSFKGELKLSESDKTFARNYGNKNNKALKKAGLSDTEITAANNSMNKIITKINTFDDTTEPNKLQIDIKDMFKNINKGMGRKYNDMNWKELRTFTQEMLKTNNPRLFKKLDDLSKDKNAKFKWSKLLNKPNQESNLKKEKAELETMSKKSTEVTVESMKTKMKGIKGSETTIDDKVIKHIFNDEAKKKKYTELLKSGDKDREIGNMYDKVKQELDNKNNSKNTSS